jgi:hypothetical protein
MTFVYKSNRQLIDEFQTATGLAPFDNTPTASSVNGVSSGGVYTALQSKQNTIDKRR